MYETVFESPALNERSSASPRYSDLYRDGAMSHVDRALRVAGTVPVDLIWAKQSAQEVVEPATPDFNLALCLRGKVEVYRGVGTGLKSLGTAVPGSLLLTPAGAEAHWRWHGDHEVMIMAVNSQRASVLTSEVGDLDFLVDTLSRSIFRDDLIKTIFSTLWTEADRPDGYATLLCDQLTLALLLRLKGLSEGGDATLDRHKAPPPRLQRAIEFIEVNLNRELTLAQLANVAALSPAHFSRSFHAATGLSPFAFVSQRRIERAKILLTNTRTPLSEIAFECGFKSQSHFGRVFKEMHKMTPGLYRHSSQ